MTRPEQDRPRNFAINLRAAALTIVLLLIVAAIPAVQAQTFTVIYSFTGKQDGGVPYSGVTMDGAGNLYGTTGDGGNLACNAPYGCGTVFQLTPSGSGWTESLLYTFGNGSDGSYPVAGLIFDQSGNLYGATAGGGSGGGGTVFELSPAGGSWNSTLLYSFIAGLGGAYCGPWGTLVMDRAGNLYGTTYCDGKYGYGSVFKLTNTGSGWAYSLLHDFGGSGGSYPISNVILDTAGNLYGTASDGGSPAYGVVWEITP